MDLGQELVQLFLVGLGRHQAQLLLDGGSHGETDAAPGQQADAEAETAFGAEVFVDSARYGLREYGLWLGNDSVGGCCGLEGWEQKLNGGGGGTDWTICILILFISFICRSW